MYSDRRVASTMRLTYPIGHLIIENYATGVLGLCQVESSVLPLQYDHAGVTPGVRFLYDR